MRRWTSSPAKALFTAALLCSAAGSVSAQTGQAAPQAQPRPVPPAQTAPAPTQPAPTAAAPAPAPSAPAGPGCDTACVRANNEIASQLCAPRIEAEAPTDFEWVSRPFAKIFQKAEAPEGAGTLVRYRGDSIRFLSPQKEWVRVSYECGFDAAKRSIDYVRVRLGRLDKPEATPQPSQNPRQQMVAPPQAPQQAAQADPALQKRPVPSEPSGIEIRQVNPRSRPTQP